MDNAVETQPTQPVKKKLVMLRGISGSGKSTLAKQIVTEFFSDSQQDVSTMTIIFSTDDYFINPHSKKYEFNGAMLGKAHAWNQQRVKDAMQKNQLLIIVDNTNTQKWEMTPYVKEAVNFGYEVVFQEPTTPWANNAQELAKKNQHQVPLEAIERMLQRYETDVTIQSVLSAKPPPRKK